MNSPKTATFGGVQRARVSSQCWKRAIREAAAAESPYFKGERTRLIIEPLRDALQSLGLPEPEAKAKAIEIGEALATYDKENEKKTGTLKVKTIFFTSPTEVKALAAAYVETRDVKKAVKALKPEHLKDAADVAIFGRMVAADHSLTLEGAAMFSHALSTHKVDNEIDFFTAVDDLNPADDSGSGHMGTTEFNAATYYRYAAVNLSMLADEHHLASMSLEERKKVIRAFIEATLTAVPQARHNSMNANTPVDYVLAIVKDKGQPVQLVNAFEAPIFARNGLAQASARALLLQRKNLNRFFGSKDQALATGTANPAPESKASADGTQLTKEDLPEWANLETFIQRLTAHVI
jgi:CRISPR system Cascade subunit CasC